jgi:esterase/lipase superfamily enzyme
LLAEKRDLRPKVKEIILAAPDIDAGTFKSAIAPALVGAGRPITLYASSDDKALQASRKVHGEARLGNAGKSLVVMPGVETVDATGVDTSFVAHSYYGSIPAVLADIYHIIHNSLRAYQRASLQPAGSPTAVYWMFAK